MKLLADNNINVGIGSDSLASNHTLNFFEELRAMRRKYPFLSPEKIVEMATFSGAKALKLSDGVGEIRTGYRCDLIGVMDAGNGENVYDTVIENRDKLIHITQNS